MAKFVRRDRVWNVAMKQDEPFAVEDLLECLDAGERTLRDTLNSMADCGWLEKTGGKGSEPVRYRSLVVVAREDGETGEPLDDVEQLREARDRLAALDASE